MKISVEKARRLEQVARMYFEHDRTQAEIARHIGVSRPMISKLLSEAKAAGIVEIKIRSLAAEESEVLQSAQAIFGLEGGRVLPEYSDDHQANQALASAAIDYLRTLGGGRLGLGWGRLIGAMVRQWEARVRQPDVVTEVCPLIGNSGMSSRDYHSNENVRIVAHQAMGTPHYLHTPAFAETRQEMNLLKQTVNYKAVEKQWRRLDVALVNIGNHPSTPDFASRARYGDLLNRHQAVGRLIAYYYDINGVIINSGQDYAVQIPLPLLRKSRQVVGVCSANVGWRALKGALKTGLITHLVAREEVLRQALEF